jgi:hypothetical protein
MWRQQGAAGLSNNFFECANNEKSGSRYEARFGIFRAPCSENCKPFKIDEVGFFVCIGLVIALAFGLRSAL